MSGRRFAALVALAALVVGAGSFAAGLAVFDDGRPDPPPDRAGSGDTTEPPAGESPTAPTTATTTPPIAVTEGPIATPAWIAIVASESSPTTARAKAEAVAAKGLPAGVLSSDDYPSLKRGLWVAYAGPYTDHAAADAAVDQLASRGIGGAYVRCAGTEKQCREGRDD